MSKFYIGQKVVCIDANGYYPLGTDILVEGKIYEISKITLNGIGCHLVGVNAGMKVNGYNQNRFIPAKEQDSFADQVLNKILKEVEHEIGEEIEIDIKVILNSPIPYITVYL